MPTVADAAAVAITPFAVVAHHALAYGGGQQFPVVQEGHCGGSPGGSEEKVKGAPVVRWEVGGHIV